MPDTPGKCRDQEDSDYLADDAKRGVGSKEGVRQWMHRLHVQACECTKTHSSAEETLGLEKPVCKMNAGRCSTPLPRTRLISSGNQDTSTFSRSVSSLDGTKRPPPDSVRLKFAFGVQVAPAARNRTRWLCFC